MRHPAGPHVPAPEFRAQLEREVVRAFRDDGRSHLQLSGGGWQRLRTAAMIVLALATGATATMVSAQVQDARERNALLVGERTALELADARVELALASARETRVKVDLGIADRDALIAAESELRSMEANRDRHRLNVEEIEATSRAPRDDLAAPRAGGRDFMRARLDLELAAAQQRMIAAESRVAVARQRHAMGATSPLVVLEAETDVARAGGELELLIGKRDLREAFLQDRLTPIEVAALELGLEQRLHLGVLERVQALAEERLAVLRQMHDVGQVDRVDLLRMELDVAERAAEIQRLRAAVEAGGGARE